LTFIGHLLHALGGFDLRIKSSATGQRPFGNILGAQRHNIPIAPKSLPGYGENMLNVDACGVHLKVVVRRRIAEVLRLDFAAIDGIPETATRFLRGLAVPAMFVYSLVLSSRR
jgi:hypothetical protein